MNKKIKKQITIISISLIIFIFSMVAHVNVQAREIISEPALTELFNIILYKVKEDYVTDVPVEKLWFGAIKGMLSATGDPHTRFMDPDQFLELTAETKGKFGGLGIEVSQRDGKLVIVTPIDGTPAMRAGIKPGDIIAEIDKKSTQGLSLNDVMKILRGKPGSSVTLSIARPGESEVLYFDLQREIIKINVVETHIFKKEKIGYVKLKQFSRTAAPAIKKALKLFKKKRLKGIIFDLRWNPGGLLDGAHKIANYFIRDGVIVSTRGRKKQWDRIFPANPKKVILPKLPLVILVNGGSASASEIVTGAVKDHKRGVVVGTKTYGKGSVQSVMPLQNRTALALTIQKYYTPSGVSIHHIGIKPNYIVKPLEFTKSDKRHFLEIKDRKLLKKFVKSNRRYNKSTVKKFQDNMKKLGLKLSNFAAAISIKREINKNKTKNKIDLEFDVQLKKALSLLKK